MRVFQRVRQHTRVPAQVLDPTVPHAYGFSRHRGRTPFPARRLNLAKGMIKDATMRSLSAGQIILLVVLCAVLILTGVWGVSVWGASSGVEMGKHGWIALGLGTFFSLLIGCGLMALMFFSSRSGHDDVADPFRQRERRDR